MDNLAKTLSNFKIQAPLAVILTLFSAKGLIFAKNSFTQVEPNYLLNTVLNGTVANIKDSFSQYTVHIKVYNSDQSIKFCTGVLIAEDIVLTAGHCFSSKTVTVGVWFGLGGEFDFITATQGIGYKYFYDSQSNAHDKLNMN